MQICLFWLPFLHTGIQRTLTCMRVPMQNLLLLAELGALGVCPCRIYYFWQNWEHRACAHCIPERLNEGRTLSGLTVASLG